MLLIKQATHITDACINTIRSYHYSSVFFNWHTVKLQLYYISEHWLNVHLVFSRKIEIVQFASRTRQLFVRLLALVKWANNAGKVEKCAVS